MSFATLPRRGRRGSQRSRTSRPTLQRQAEEGRNERVDSCQMLTAGEPSGAHERSHKSLTVQQDDGLLERQRVPDLHLAVVALQNSARQKEHKGRCLLNALEHAILCQVVGAVVVPRLEAHPLELEVDGVGLVAPSALAMAAQTHTHIVTLHVVAFSEATRSV